MELTPKQNAVADEWLTLCSQSYIRYDTKDYYAGASSRAGPQRGANSRPC